MRIAKARLAISAVAIAVLALFCTTTNSLAKPPGGGGGGPKNGTIVGEAIGPNGGVAGALVLLFNGIAIDQVDETYTDANGNFSFGQVPAGDYTVTVISFNPPCTGSTNVTVVAKKQIVIIVPCQ